MEPSDTDLEPRAPVTDDPQAVIEALCGEVLFAKVRAVGAEALDLALELDPARFGSAAAAIPCRLPLADLAAAGETPPAVGDEVEVLVEASADDPALLVASVDKADSLRFWDWLCQAQASGEEIEGEVVGKQKGGCAVDIGVRAFLPASQASLRPGADLDGLLGKRLSFNVIEFDQKRGNVVVSCKRQLEAEHAAVRASTLGKLVEGEVVTGRVRSFTDYGAFVDLGGIDGLVHVTDLSWGRIKHPKEAVSIGQEIRVKVLKLDAGRERVSLGYKQLLPDPWAAVSEKFPQGKRVQGTVVSITDYGAFVELEPGVEGLVHATEMSWVRSSKRPADLVHVGERIDAVVLAVDDRERRIALGTKQTQENPWEAFATAHPVGSTVSGVVRRIKEFGVFVETEAGLDGLVRAGDFSWTAKPGKPEELFKVGDEVKAVVLELEPAKERLALGFKQLGEDPWKDLEKRYPAGSQITGKVTSSADFGLFVEIEPGIEGLCHISQLSTERVDRPASVAKVGDELTVAVLNIDRGKRRISLSVRALSEDSGDYSGYIKEQAEEESRFGDVLGRALAQKLAADKAKAENGKG